MSRSSVQTQLSPPDLAAAHQLVLGHMVNTSSKKEKISYEECLGKYRSGVLLVVECHPGVRKTTLAHKLLETGVQGEMFL